MDNARTNGVCTHATCPSTRCLNRGGTISGPAGVYAEYDKPLRIRGPAKQVQKEARGRGNQGDWSGRRAHSTSKYSPRRDTPKHLRRKPD